MLPLFTVHTGEFLVGEHTERNFSSLNVCVPQKDTGSIFWSLTWVSAMLLH